MFFWLLKLFFRSADWERGVIVTYGKNVYSKYPLTNELKAHEYTHVLQQTTPLWWWLRYVVSPKFRFIQELEAHVNEYRAGSPTSERLRQIAGRLASPLYNNMCTAGEARMLILYPDLTRFARIVNKGKAHGRIVDDL